MPIVGSTRAGVSVGVSLLRNGYRFRRKGPITRNNVIRARCPTDATKLYTRVISTSKRQLPGI